MNNKRWDKSISALSAIVMLTVFAISILSVLLGGAQVYSRLTRRDGDSFDSRTCAGYLQTKVRSAEGPVTVEPFGDTQALCFYQQANGRRYVTRVYCYEGYLMELFSLQSGEFSPLDGEKLMPAQSLTCHLEGSRLCLVLTDQYGSEQSLYMALPCQEVSP